MAVIGQRDTIRIISVMLGMVVFSACSWFVGHQAIHQVLEAEAKATADSWADYLAIAIPDIGTVAKGGRISGASQEFLLQTTTIGDVFHYRVYDNSGAVRLDSRAGADPVDAEDTTAAQRTASTGVISLKTGNGDGVSLPAYYAEAYVPLVVNGDRLGALEVYVDQTEKSAAVEAAFFWAAIEIGALTAFAFLFPTVAYLLRSREAAQDIEFVSLHDDLTHLHNRSAFKSILDEQIRKGDAERTYFHVFFIDLDRFKNVNDSRGHATGDSVLVEVAERLRRLTAPNGEVCRLGGDEFAVYQPRDRNGADDYSLGDRIVTELSAPFRVEGNDISIGASVGVASYPANAQASGDLLKAADIALYEAKQSGRGRCVVFDPAMEDRVSKRLALEERLRVATGKNQFEIYYQPLVDSKRLAGFEALLRLDGDDGKPISPTVFIPIAEQMGLIGEIGQRTLERACQTAALWPDNLKVSVNLSALQFESGDLVDVVKGALSASGLAADRLELEITEGILIRDTAQVIRQLEQVKALGVTIALDDFGTGYSSLSYLWMFPFDRVKVDRSFVSRLSEEDAKSREILSSILALGKSLEMAITAEGVETQEQSIMLREMKVDTIQGYLYGRPVPEADLAATILKLRAGFDSTSPGASVDAKRKAAATAG